jgi:hypothetical protein
MDRRAIDSHGVKMTKKQRPLKRKCHQTYIQFNETIANTNLGHVISRQLSIEFATGTKSSYLLSFTLMSGDVGSVAKITSSDYVDVNLQNLFSL